MDPIALNWLGGDVGTRRSVAVSKAFRVKVLQKVNHELSARYKNYTPWMNYFDKTPELKKFYSLSFADISKNPKLIQQLKSAIEEEGRLDLGLDDGMSVSIDDKESHVEFVKAVNKSARALFDAVGWMEELFSNLVLDVIPVSDDQFERIGLSSHDLKGALFFKLNKTSNRSVAEPQLSVDIAHELAHQVLAHYFTADPLIISDHAEKLFSPIRNEHREAARVLHSAAALSFEVIAIRNVGLKSQSDLVRELSALEGRERSTMLNHTLDLLAMNCEFSTLGSEILNDMKLINEQLGWH